MTAGVVTVGGKKYAVGLYWQVSDSANAAKAARTAAVQPGAVADFFCIRPGNNKGRAPQFGLGEARFGHKWNMPTAAATLANRQPGSWVGVFTVPEGVWFIEVRDDLIAPEGDLLFADEAEAMSRLQDASARGGLEKIFAPATWGIPGAEASSLPALLSGRADVRLQPVKVPKKLILGILGTLIAAIVLYSGVNYILEAREEAAAIERQENMRRQAEIQRQQQEEAKRREEEEKQRQLQLQAQQLPTYQRTWEQAPRPLAWLRACRDAFDKVVVAPLGWSITSVSCNGVQVSATWARTTGPADIPPGAKLDPSLKSASAQFPLAPLAPRGDDPLWPPEAIDLYILHNDWTADVNRIADAPAGHMPDGRPIPPPPWTSRQVRWTVPLAPWEMKGPLVDLPGFMVQNLIWQQDGSWQIEGVLYEQRK